MRRLPAWGTAAGTGWLGAARTAKREGAPTAPRKCAGLWEIRALAGAGPHHVPGRTERRAEGLLLLNAAEEGSLVESD